MMTTAAHCPWFRPTPARLLVALFAAEAVLPLSQRFEWFAFNQHKGWTVLIAVAAVAAFLLLMLLWFLLALAFRVRFQFSVRSLLILPVVAAIPCGWLGMEMRAAKGQRGIVRQLRGGGDVLVRYDYQRDWLDTGSRPPAPSWLCVLLGDDLFADVNGVSPRLPGESVLGGMFFFRAKGRIGIGGDLVVECAKGLPELREVNVFGAGITDAGLRSLKGATKLRILCVRASPVTDAGLRYVKGLSGLRQLDLSYTKISDAGLEHLTRLSHLESLDLAGTGVTDTGVRALHEALPRCKILYRGDIVGGANPK
jgi:hypothetical protein